MLPSTRCTHSNETEEEIIAIFACKTLNIYLSYRAIKKPYFHQFTSSVSNLYSFISIADYDRQWEYKCIKHSQLLRKSNAPCRCFRSVPSCPHKIGQFARNKSWQNRHVRLLLKISGITKVCYRVFVEIKTATETFPLIRHG